MRAQIYGIISNFEPDMANTRIVNPDCHFCGKSFQTKVFSMIDAVADPGLKESILNGDALIAECPHCGQRQVLQEPLVYIDRGENILLCLTPEAIKGEAPEGFTARQVRDAGSLIEKIRIFDAGFDDIAIEMCKFLTVREMDKDMELKFFRTDGADGDLIFTYPSEGKMEMISVGFNVYEDCCAIIGRNPVLKQNATGLATVDAGWLASFMK